MSGMLKKKSAQRNRRIAQARTDDLSRSSSGGGDSFSRRSTTFAADSGPAVAFAASVRTTGGLSASAEKPSGRTSICLLKKSDILGGTICGGIMGTNGRLFCTKPNCNISHRGEVVDISEEGTFFTRKSPTMCHVIPSLDLSLVPENLRSEWPSLKLSVEEWEIKFSEHRQHDPNVYGDDRVVEVFQGRLDNVLQAFRVPSPNVERGDDEASVDSDSTGPPDLLVREDSEDEEDDAPVEVKVTTVPPGNEDSEFSSEDDDDEVEVVMTPKRPSSGKKDSVDDEEEEVEEVEEGDGTVYDALMKLDSRLMLIEAELLNHPKESLLKEQKALKAEIVKFRASVGVGSIGALAERFKKFRELWPLVEKMTHSLTEVAEKVKDYQGKRFTVKVLDVLRSNLDAITKHVAQSFEMSGTDDITRLKSDASDLEDDVTNKFSSLKSTLKAITKDVKWSTARIQDHTAKFSLFEERMTQAEQSKRTSRPSNQTSRGGGRPAGGRGERKAGDDSDSEDGDDGRWNGGYGDMSTIRNDNNNNNNDESNQDWVSMEMFLALKAQVEKLQAQVIELIQASDQQAIQFFGLGFKSFADFCPWSKEFFPDNQFGSIMDPMVLLTCCDTENMSLASMLTQFKQMSALKIGTRAEANSIHSLGVVYPELFHDASAEATAKATASVGVNPSSLNKIPTYAAWSKPRHGVKTTLLERLANINASITAAIGSIYKPGSTAHSIATTALSQSMLFIQNLVAFVEETYSNLTVQSKYSVAQAWCLTTQLLARVFDELHKVRVGALDRLDCNNMEGVCAHVLWTCFNTLDKCQELIDDGIKNSAAIASEYVKFLAVNSGSEKLDATVDKLDEHCTKLNTMEKEVKAVAKKADTASAHFDDIKKRLVKLEQAKK